MIVNENYEDYVKAIYLILKRTGNNGVSNAEIADFLGVKAASVSGALHRLKDEGLVFWNPREPIRLTDKGTEIGIQIAKNYDVLKKFFTDVLKLTDKSLVNKLCCGIEHHLTPEITEALDEYYDSEDFNYI